MKKHPLLFLLIIPAQLLIDAVVFFFASMADTAIVDPAAQGHPMPVFTLIAFFVLGILTVAAVIVAIVLTIRGVVRKRRGNVQ